MGEAEVQALLSQGLVRTNDLAFEVSPENGKALTDWKMLWQFPEFDRRAKDGAKPVKVEDGERRAQAPAKSIEERVKEALPEELLNITPEDLIPRQGLGGPGTRLAQVEDDEIPETRAENTEGSKAMRWAGIGLGALVGISLFAQWISSPRKNLAPVEAMERALSSPEEGDSGLPAKTLSRSLPGGARPRNVGSTAAPAAAVPLPSARDEEPVRREGGTIPFDASRERGDDEMAEEDDAVAEDFTFESSRKAAKKKKKKLASPDDSGVDEDDAIEAREPADTANEEID